MLKLQRLGVVVALVIATTACSERLVYEASSDPTIAESDVSTTITTDDSTDDPASGSATDTTVSSDTISWVACPESLAPLECGQLAVPFDYENPSAGSFVLSLIRRPADIPESRIGSPTVSQCVTRESLLAVALATTRMSQYRDCRSRMAPQVARIRTGLVTRGMQTS